MKAGRLFGKDDLRLTDIPVLEIADDEILLKVRSAAVCGTDVRMLKNGVQGVDEAHPLTPGHEIAGDIAAVGPKADPRYTPGMRAAAAPNVGCGHCGDCISGNTHMCRDYRALGIHLDGGFAEYVRIPGSMVRAGNLIPLADHVSYDAAALTEPLSCVYNGISRCGIRPGDVVFIFGAGPIGIMHAMLAKLSGAGKVLIHDISPERLDAAAKFDPFFVPVCKDAEEAAAEETKGRGADVVITACPSPSAQQSALRMAANFGRICFFGGLPADRREVPLDTNLIHYKQLTVTGSTRASLKQFRDCLGFVTSGLLEVDRLITAAFPIEEIGEAFDRAAAAKGLKNVIHMG